MSKTRPYTFSPYYERARTVDDAPAERRRVVLAAAVECAKRDGYQWILRQTVAQQAGVSVATVSNAFGSMIDLKRAVLTEAVRLEVLEIVAQGLADGHAIVRAAPAELRARAAATLAG